MRGTALLTARWMPTFGGLLLAACGGGGGGGGGEGEVQLAIPAAAFEHVMPDSSWQNNGRWAAGADTSPGVPSFAEFVAPVPLPHGATITRLTFYFEDGGGSGVTDLRLLRYSPPSMGGTELAELNAPDTFGGFGSVSTTEFYAPTLVDATQHSHVLRLMVSNPPGPAVVHGIGAVVSYTPAAPASPAYHVLAPAAFGAATNSRNIYTDTSNLINSGAEVGPEISTVVAPVVLPDGATVDQFELLWRRYDTASLPIEARFHRVALGTELAETLATASSNPGTGPLGGSHVVPVSPAITVNNAGYAYWIAADVPKYLDSPVRFLGVRLRYVPPATAGARTTLPAAAFRPVRASLDYANDGTSLLFYGDSENLFAYGYFIAPVQLPKGTTVQRIRFHWQEDSVDPGRARLRRMPWGSSTPETIALAETPGDTAGFGSSTDDTVTGGALDPTKYAYWVELQLPFTWSPSVTLDIRAQAVVIEHAK